MKVTTKVNGKEVSLYVGYAMDGADEFYSTWEGFFKAWLPYYDSKAEIMEKAWITAVVETEGGLPLSAKRVVKPLTTKEKQEFAEKTAAEAYGMVTLENV